MSIAILSQVYDEMRRLAIAGSVVAGGDFRLKKLVQPLEQAGAKAPVFAKVGQAVQALVDSNEKTSSDALLELSTLVNAILYTQGETGLAGTLTPLETTDLGAQTTQASARLLKPVLEALNDTGSGRLEKIKDAHRRGAFSDMRLVKPALDALDDPYPEIGQFVASKVLPLYGKAILPELKAKFDLKGRGGHVRRLKLMHRLDPAGTRELVKQSLENGSKEMKVVAIECLGDAPEDLSFLLEQAVSKNKEVRGAALQSLAKVDADEAVAALQKALQGNDLELAVRPVQKNRSPKLLKFLIPEAEQQLDALFKVKDKKALGKQTERLLSLLECLRGRDDKATEAFLLKVFKRGEEIAKLKGEPSGQDVNNRMAMLLAYGSKATQQALIDAHESLSADILDTAFFAARRALTPAEVFKLFSPYLLAKVDEKKKQRDPAYAKREAISEALERDSRWSYRYGYFDDDDDDEDDDEDFDEDNYATKISTRHDPRWLDLAVQIKHMELVAILARPDHAASNALLAESFAESMKKKGEHFDYQVLRTMVRVQHPGATDAVLAAVKKESKSKYASNLYWLSSFIPDLPKSSLPQFEELLPTLDEKCIDRLLDSVTAVKNKP